MAHVAVGKGLRRAAETEERGLGGKGALDGVERLEHRRETLERQRLGEPREVGTRDVTGSSRGPCQDEFTLGVAGRAARDPAVRTSLLSLGWP